METLIIVLGVVFIVAAAIFESPLIDILLDVGDDLKNRNDRGKLKRPSEKYLCR